MNFSELGLSAPILLAIKQANYENPYPIQIEAIPAMLQKRDILGLAQTGSGKTAAYILPILEELQQKDSHKSRFVSVLVIVPTRELAAQVEEVIRSFGNYLPRKVKSTAVFGGVSINTQMIKLQGTDILVATPGRLLDLISKNAISVTKVSTLVIDEADKVLNLGFKDEVHEILSLLPKKRQNILFSATMDTSVKELIDKLLINPLKIALQAEEAVPNLIAQKAYLVSREKKGPLLRHLIQAGKWQQVLVFTSSIRAADNLTAKLNKNGIQARALHGDKSQGARTEALDQFKRGKLSVLVATDLASRGLDIQALPHVVNFELPRSPKDYIHRIGRTGRAGAEGEAISLITEDDLPHWKVIQKKIKIQVTPIETENLAF